MYNALSQIAFFGTLFVLAWSLTELLAINTAERLQKKENKRA
jgi:hypothetical protein